MTIKTRPMGPYMTNCYIVTVDSGQIIIDPGMGATNWVLDNTTNPLAILNTHGHFDHVFSNAALQKALKVPLYAPQGDIFMLQNDIFGQGVPPSTPDYAVDGDEVLNIGGIEVKFWHFPGHTPGCFAIEIEDAFFSGDFIFKGSIGRVDFPYSDPTQMKKSLEKFAQIPFDRMLYPGHGESSTIKNEQRHVPRWLSILGA